MRIQFAILPAPEDVYAYVVIIDGAEQGHFTQEQTEYIAQQVGAKACLVFSQKVEVF